MKKSDEMKAQHKAILAGAQTLFDEKKYTEAKAKISEAMNLKTAIEIQEQLEEEERIAMQAKAKDAPRPQELDAVKRFATAARSGFRNSMTEGTNSEGGYTVPEDIQTKIQQYRTSKRSLLDLVTVETVTTESGARTFKKRSQQTGFVNVAEGGAIGQKATPQFERIEYTIGKYAGYFPVTNELLQDSDANITRVLTEWIGDESRVTANKLVLAKINEKPATTLTGLDDIKRALNVTLGSAFKTTAKIITNDNGLQWLDTLKDSDGQYLLQASPADPMEMRLCAGATAVPVEVLPNTDMPNDDTYEVTSDTTVTAGKTYYVKNGDVYTAVADATGNPTELQYYELTDSKIPVIIGDLKEGIIYWDRKKMNIKASDIASIGDFNAYENDLTIFRAIEREAVTQRDPEAFVNGRITEA